MLKLVWSATECAVLSRSGVGTWMTTLPSGGWSRDLCWLRLWYSITLYEVMMTWKQSFHLQRYIFYINVFYRSTLCFSSASSSSSCRSYSPQTSVEMNPAFTCKWNRLLSCCLKWRHTCSPLIIMCVCVCVVLQEVGSLHSAADPSVWDPLHCVCLLPRERQQEGAPGVWTRPRILPGEKTERLQLWEENVVMSFITWLADVSLCVFWSHPLNLCVSSGLCGGRPLLLPERRGKPPLNQ